MEEASWSPADPIPCEECGDGCGWSMVGFKSFGLGAATALWLPCVSCNRDGRKPKPELCKDCGRREEICWCQKEVFE